MPSSITPITVLSLGTKGTSAAPVPGPVANVQSAAPGRTGAISVRSRSPSRMRAIRVSNGPSSSSSS